MEKINSKRLHENYSLFLSLLIFVVGGLFLYHIIGIYSTGDTRQYTYTKEIVLEHFLDMIIPVIILITTIIGSSILSIIYPNNRNEKVKFYNYELYKKLSSNVKFKIINDESKEYINTINKYKRNKIIFALIVSMICFLSALIGLFYLFNQNNFDSSKPNESMIKMSLYFLPFICVSFISLISYTLYEESLAEKQLNCLRKLISLKAFESRPCKIKKERKILITRIAILIISITFIVVGVYLGELKDVLIKAINICNECIGLG